MSGSFLEPLDGDAVELLVELLQVVVRVLVGVAVVLRGVVHRGRDGPHRLVDRLQAVQAALVVLVVRVVDAVADDRDPAETAGRHLGAGELAGDLVERGLPPLARAREVVERRRINLERHLLFLPREGLYPLSYPFSAATTARARPRPSAPPARNASAEPSAKR